MGIPTVWRHAYIEKSSYAKKWFWWGTTVQLVLLGGGLVPSGIWSNGAWTNRDLAVATSLVLLLLAAWQMHSRDYDKTTKTGRGYGLRYVYYSFDSKHRLDDNVISGVLSRESIQGAITLLILSTLIDKGRAPSGLTEIIRDPSVLVFSVVTAALGASVITTLAAILCYDYSSRFTWPDPVRSIFISKGHDLGRVGFYTLMWSLAAITALLNYVLCMFMILGVFLVMWWYYFFPVSRIEDALKDAKKRLEQRSPSEQTL